MDQVESTLPPVGLDNRGDRIRLEGSHSGPTNVTGGNVLQGNFVGVTINSTAASKTDYVGQFSHSSLQPVKAFVPRPLLRDQVRSQLCKDAAARSTNIVVVFGLGGFGKTQLMLDYAQEYHAEYEATFWLEAGSTESLERDFVNLWRAFSDHTSASQEHIDVETAIGGVKNWFSGRAGPWLMVFDGADSIDNEKASGYIDIKRYIPNAAALHVVIVTRSSAARDMTRLEAVEVDEMSESQAEDLFYNYSQLDPSDQSTKAEVTAIVRELGCLALAVTLAATYVGSTPRLQSDIAKYLPEYKQRRHELLGRRAESLVHGYSKSVLTTWETSYKAVEEQNEAAADFLSLLSFLSFDDIYLELFSNVREGTEAEIMDIYYTTEEYFRVLQKFSLVQWKPDRKTYAMHKIVHAWGYDRLSTERQSEFGHAALLLVMAAIRSCERPQEKLRLVPHVMASFATIAQRKDGFSESMTDEIHMIGHFMASIGRWTEVLAIRKYVAGKRAGALGDDHPDTIDAMRGLTLTLWHQGQLGAATTMGREVLEKSRRTLGNDHLDTISAMHDYAYILQSQGQIEKAAELGREVVEKRKQILGDDHLATLKAINDFATILQDRSQLELAAIAREVLEKTKQTFGNDHPGTISAMNNYANMLRSQGQIEKAAELGREVVEKRKQILGDDHPDTISAMHNYAGILRDLGQLEAAAAMERDVIEKRKQIQGDEHPGTINAMHNYATTLQKQGQLETAAAMQRDVVEKRRRIQGDDHPDTINAMHNYAIILRRQGKPEAAVALWRELLERRRRILGDDHPDTIRTMKCLEEMS